MNCSKCNDPVLLDAATDGWGGYLCARCAPQPPEHTITLTLRVAPGVEPEHVVDYLNCEALCRMEEDDQIIRGWAWGDPQVVTSPTEENTTEDDISLLLDPREAAMNAWDGEREVPKEVL